MIKLIQKQFFILSLFLLNPSYAEEYAEYKANPPIKNPPALEKRFPEIKAENYKEEVYKGAFAKTILSSGDYDNKEDAQEALNKKEVDFAGKYAVFTTGCGSGCSTIELINVKTGKITNGITFYYPPMPIEPYKETFDSDYSYSKDSRLFYAEGMISVDALDKEGKKMGGEDTGSFVFEFKDGQFRLLEYKPILKIYEEDENSTE